MYTQNEKVEPIDVAEEMSRSFLDYSMSVIISRALPDARDGLKPAQRRIPRDAASRNAPADDQQVEMVVGQACEGAGAGECGPGRLRHDRPRVGRPRAKPSTDPFADAASDSDRG